MEEVLALETVFAQVKDPRLERTKKHRLRDILIIAICATICGAEGWVEMEEFGKAKEEWFTELLELEHGIPSHDTFGRVFALLDPKELQTEFREWVLGICPHIQGVIAIDGKTSRGSGAAEQGKKPLHLVSAWSVENRLVLAQLATEEKSNEITAIPLLLQQLALKGCLVTIDAMGTQVKIAAQIIEQGGEYALALKDNQKDLCEEVKATFALAPHDQSLLVEETRTLNKGHGRLERRTYQTISDPDTLRYLDPQQRWASLRAVGMVKAERQIGEERSCETRYYLLSFPEAELFAQAVRGHWGIEIV